MPGRVVPDVVGQNFLEALVAVSPHFQLRGEGTPRVSSDVPNGTILSQRPAPGTPVDPNESEIPIWVVMSISPD
jgi:beta-lactam-binding protein with PASTA domain